MSDMNEEKVVENCEVKEADTVVEATENVEAKNEKKHKNIVRFDKETGFVVLRVSNNTEPKSLGGAIFKNFMDGCRGLVISFIGKDATVNALKGISVANVYLEHTSDEEKGTMSGKVFSIIPSFHTFKTELGDATTTKIIIYAVDASVMIK